MGHQSVALNRSHTQSHLAGYWHVFRRKHTWTWGEQNTTQIVTRTQDETGDPDVTTQESYTLPGGL